jgi:hypothetical protein
LLAGWLGRKPEDVNYKDYIPKGLKTVAIPPYGAGPMRFLVPHLGMPQEDESMVVEIPEPFGWQSLYSIMESGSLEEEDDEVDIVDMVDEEDDGEEGDDE